MYKVKNELPQDIVSGILFLKMQSQYKSLQESGPAIHLVRSLCDSNENILYLEPTA